MTWLHSLALQLEEGGINLPVLLQLGLVCVVHVVRAQSVGEGVHLLQDGVKSFLYLPMDVGRERGLIDHVNGLPYLVNLAPDAT